MQIDLSNNGLLKAWMDGKVKTVVRWCLLFPNSTFIPPDVLTEFVPCLFLIMVLWLLYGFAMIYFFFFFLLCCQVLLWQSKLVPWVSQACQGDEFVRRWRSGMCVSAGPPCPLLTFVTSLTSAHPLLRTGQDSRCVDNADTLQDLVGHLSTLEPVLFFCFLSADTRKVRWTIDEFTQVSCVWSIVCVEGKNVNHVKNG